MKLNAWKTFGAAVIAGMLTLGGPATATPVLEIEEIVVNQNVTGDNLDEINIRVNTTNVGTSIAENPVIHLWVRENAAAEWRLLRTWETTPDLEPGHRLSRDFFAIGTGEFDPALFSPSFEVRAEVVADGDVTESRELVHIED